MKYFRLIGRTLIIETIIISISTFLLTILNYFNFINSGLLSIFQIIIIVISFIVGGFIIGKNSNENGWLEGFKIGIINIIILTIINLIFIKTFSFKVLIYDFILITCTTLGGMIGITKKTN